MGQRILECTYGSSAGMLSISDLHSQRGGGEGGGGRGKWLKNGLRGGGPL